MSDDIEKNYMKAYALGDSKQKLDQAQTILQNKYGNNWKRIIFAIMTVLVCIILLIIYGINIDDNPYKISLSHLKVFFIILLLSICFFIIWMVIKPVLNKRAPAVVPFPPSDTLVPVDATQCGIVPTVCNNNLDCKKNCSIEGKTNYSCQTITHPNVYYLGTKLELNKSYCLPKAEQLAEINDCGTYTGRIVWAKNPDGSLSWQCQCLYPDIFSGPSCTKQIACAWESESEGLLTSGMSELQDDKGNVWNTISAPPADSYTPYDSANGKPRFKCNCPEGFYSLDSDPFTCNRDLCYVGMGSSNVGYFDKNTNKCVCNSGNENVTKIEKMSASASVSDSKPTPFPTKNLGDTISYKSNISGFCYPLQASEPHCNLNINGNGCKYGVNIYYHDVVSSTDKYILFKNKDGKFYMTDFKELNKNNIQKLVDITDIVIANKIEYKFNDIDISNTILQDAFYSFGVNTPDINGIGINDINGLFDQGGMRSRLTKIAEDAANIRDKTTGEYIGGLAQLCDSYYYNRDLSKYPKCNDPLSKTGTQPLLTTLENVCGDDKTARAIVDIDNYPYGYHCDCGDSARYEHSDSVDIRGQKPNICFSCVPSGQKPEKAQYQQCCLYQTDKNGKVQQYYKNFKENLEDPNILCGKNKDECCYENLPPSSDFTKNDKDDYPSKYKCSVGIDCIGLGCGYMDEKDNKNENKVCCPYGSVSTYTFGDDWCHKLKKGDKCKHDGQCEIGSCENNICSK